MPDRIKVDDRFTIEVAPPSPERLAELAQEGFRSVVSLRTPGEANEILSPDREGELAQQHGLAFVNVPVSPQDMNFDAADRFNEEVPRLPGPVVVHCASGLRAGLFTFMHVARTQGWDGDEAVKRAEQLGFAFGTPEAKDFLKRYVDRGKAE
jgi:uncharacterized protein (TIGR01244 family)